MRQDRTKIFIRDLSWLEFNERVMQEAEDTSNTLHDRLKFLGIFSNNQDEFFRVRVAALNRMKALGKNAKMHLEDNPAKILKNIASKVKLQSKEFDQTYNAIIKEMAASKIFIKNEAQLTIKQKDFVRKYFNQKVRTEIVPLMIESIPKMPYLKDKSIYLAIVMGNTKFDTFQRYALIEIPTKTLPRFIQLPSSMGRTDLILLEDIIRFNLPHVFAPFGYNRFMSYTIKVTRDAEFTLDHDLDISVIEQLESGLKGRKKGKATRFVFDRDIDQGLLYYLSKRLFVDSPESMIPGGRIHNFKDFMDFPSNVFQSEKKSTRKQIEHPLTHQPCRIMEVIKKQDILLHFPYHKFDPLIDLIREAAIDPFVESIKITCYRLAKNSKIMNALINAVRNGKKVTAILELRARFDEEANLVWKEKLEEEGVNVILGIPNMKIHAKICIIKKREFKKIKYFGFISTGNFNENTARFYGDYCLVTSNSTILNDVNKVFRFLESKKRPIEDIPKCKVLPISPINTRSTWINHIENEIQLANNGQPARIIIKLNSLVDELLIAKLYEAAKAGVEVNLIVRGIFSAIPNQRGFKKQINAISIVDEYLEHARVMVFENNGDPQVFISSADWMVRNLDHRIEISTPIFDKSLKKELIDILEIQLKDNVKARILDNKQLNNYVKRTPNQKIINSQVATAEYLNKKALSLRKKQQ